MKKRVLSLILSICLISGIIYIPTITYAEEFTEGDFKYKVTENNTASITKCLITSGAVTVPSTIGGYPVTIIDELCFRYSTGITSVTLPEGITTIKYGAFSGGSSNNRLTELATINLPSTLTTLGSHVFNGCSSLKTINLGNNLTALSDYAFNGCSSLETVNIGNNLITIGEYVFQGCSSLRSFAFTNNLTSIGKYAFDGCSSLTEINLSADLTSLGDYAFQGCTGIKELAIPEGFTCFNLSSYTFKDCTGLEKVSLPDTLTNLGSSTFYNCTNLSEINIPSSIGEYGGSGTFYGCASLETITIPEGVKAAPYGMFRNAVGLKKINLPSTLTRIMEGAFERCTALEEITLPESLTTIDNKAFKGCTKLSKINYPKNLTTLGESGVFQNTNITAVTVPEGITALPNHAFYKMSSLENVNLPSTLKSIGFAAFYECSLITKIVLPDSVETISDQAFYKCSSLSDINFPKSWKNAGGKSIFSYCSSLTSITIPEGVTAIPANAFKGASTLTSALTEVNLPSTLTTIGSQAFQDNHLIKEYILPRSFTTLGTNALKGVAGTVYCPESALGVTQLIDAKVPFVISDHINSYDSFVYPDTDYYTLDNTDLNLGYIPFEVSYKVKDSVEITDKKLIIKFPTSAKFLENTFELDGITLSNYQLYKNQLTIPLTENQGTFRFYIKPTEYTDFLSYAKMEYNKNGSAITEIIGVIDSSTLPVTIHTDKRVGTNTIKADGIAPPFSDVGLYINDSLVTTVTSKGSGSYSASIPLANPQNYKNYTVTAKTMADNQEVTASSSVLYEQDLPEVEELLLGYIVTEDFTAKWKYYDLKNCKYSPMIIWRGGNYKFKLKLTNPETIEEAYIVSTRNNQKRYMDAIWDEETKSFLAEGNFKDADGNDVNFRYVPGKLSVEYRRKQVNVPISTKVNTDELLEYMDPALKKSTTTVNKDTYATTARDGEGELDATINIADELTGLLGDEVNFTIKTALRYYDKDVSNLMETGDDIYSYFFDKDSDKYVLNLDFTDKEDVVMVLHDISSNKQLTYKIRSKWEKTPDSTGTALTVLNGISQVTGTLSTVFDIESDYEDLRKQVMAKGMTDEDRAIALKKIEELKKDREMFLLVTSVISAATMSLGTVGAPVIAFGLLFGAVKETSGFFWNMRMADILGQSIEFSPRWKIDPSGYVYEDIDSCRIQGVTTTAYWIKPDYITDDGYDTSKSVKWDSEEYDQQNPLTTDEDGKYAWDVPEGMWQVKYEKDGYATEYSDWLPVPPPQTEVNIAMVSSLPPEIKKIDLRENKVTIKFNRPVIVGSIENIEILDENEKPLTYQASYDAETGKSGNQVSCSFDFDVSGTPYFVKTNENIKSYANVGMADKTIDIPFPNRYCEFDLFTNSASFTSSSLIEDAQVSAAAYIDGRLVSIDTRTIDIARGTTDIEFTKLITEKADTVKIFVWENQVTQKPMFETYVLEIH